MNTTAIRVTRLGKRIWKGRISVGSNVSSKIPAEIAAENEPKWRKTQHNDWKFPLSSDRSLFDISTIDASYITSAKQVTNEMTNKRTVMAVSERFSVDTTRHHSRTERTLHKMMYGRLL